MDDNLRKYMELKKKVELAQQKADRAEGALQQVMNRLEEDFECSSVEDAEKKLKILEKQKQKAKEEFENAVEAFEEKWGNA